MSVNVTLIQSIKANFAGQTSDELRHMLERRDRSRYSDEAFAAAQEILDERARGLAPEPPPRTPEVELSPEQLSALADDRLRRQVRLIGIWYYIFAGGWLCTWLLYVQSPQVALIPSLAILLPVVLFWHLGFHLRRFSSGARVVVLCFSILCMVNFPIGTLFGYYCFDKLTRGEHLFGGAGR